MMHLFYCFHILIFLCISSCKKVLMTILLIYSNRNLWLTMGCVPLRAPSKLSTNTCCLWLERDRECSRIIWKLWRFVHFLVLLREWYDLSKICYVTLQLMANFHGKMNWFPVLKLFYFDLQKDLENHMKEMTERLKMLFKFAQGAAHVWDVHEIGLAKQERALQEKLEQCRQVHDNQNQVLCY